MGFGVRRRLAERPHKATDITGAVRYAVERSPKATRIRTSPFLQRGHAIVGLGNIWIHKADYDEVTYWLADQGHWEIEQGSDGLAIVPKVKEGP